MYRMYGISGGMDAKERMCLLEIGGRRTRTGSIHKYIHVFSLRPAKAVENCSRQFCRLSLVRIIFSPHHSLLTTYYLLLTTYYLLLTTNYSNHLIAQPMPNHKDSEKKCDCHQSCTCIAGSLNTIAMHAHAS